MLSTLTVAQIADAVNADDDAPFRRVSGIGPKTAKLIVLQLAGKVHTPRGGATTGAATAPTVSGQVVQALIGLGWSERTASEALESVVADAGEADRVSVPALLRLTLSALGPARKERIGG